MSLDHSPITCINSTNIHVAAISHGTKTPTLTKLILKSFVLEEMENTRVLKRITSSMLFRDIH